VTEAPGDSTAAGAGNTYGLLAAAARRAPDRESVVFLPSGALDCEPVSLTRMQFLARVTQTANGLASLGVGPTDVVSVLLPNLLQAQFGFWGAEAIGIVNPINFLLGAPQIAEIMNAAQSKVLITLGPHPALDLWSKAQALRERVPGLETMLVVGAEQPGTRSFDTLMLQASPDPGPGVGQQLPGDLAALFHTGGTTGSPRLVAHTHANEVCAALTMARCFEFDDSDTVLCGLPLFHVAGPLALTLAPLAAGARIIMPTPAGNRDPLLLRNYWRIAAKHAATVIGGVPTTLADLLQLSEPPPLPPDGRRICMAGGAQLTRGLQELVLRETGYPVHQVYGMTETAAVIAATPRAEVPRLGSVGKAVAGMELRIGREPCATGEPGAILVRGPTVTPGYHLGHSGLAPACDGEGWLDTGDLGYLDADGWLYITGRAKDVIIRSGHNIDPALIEEVALTHPEVRQAVAVGRPDLRAGEVPVVFVELRDGARCTPAELRQYIIERVPEAPAKPDTVFVVPRIPVTAVGKTYRPALRREAARSYVAERLREILPPGNLPEVLADEDCHHVIKLLLRFPGPEAQARALAQVAGWLSQHAFEYAVVPRTDP
jgi:fatty-acyl-CoA synthase